ncbi:hypothetical protein BFI38_10315 [Yersinia pestis subsp. microtus bv. Caucasica]|uniref:YbaY family lipoprotein n=1 Tax=Yersinia pestis TaxID=632 RepID=UPI00015021A9|nr:YbaY family lipoprotein [Yersinia pestis]ABP41137.1 lipoprotein [Yersinia pestis Pestoides F]AJI97430.1 type III secretion system lipochaperone family protein [Yersinia pestis Pestoides F]AJK23047.1 type III secretion system lipochaperone family protein [Yersinia pestis Pestoides G]AKS57918.1 type III secretion system lipochaperone family protein [Yersinia pestis 1412]AKS77550.1 type III secretion system lipochaperone family protein [Yersinia pestis 1413]
MKPWQPKALWQIVGGAALAVSLTGCAHQSAEAPVAAPISTATVAASVAQSTVHGTVNIRERLALPPDAVVTVTLSDISLADAPSRVIAQKAVRTEGKQAPFTYSLPFNPSDIQPNARVIVSAAITRNGQLLFITDTIQEVINRGAGTQADLLLVPVPSVALEIVPAPAAATIQ